jgi:hypothetical protein
LQILHHMSVLRKATCLQVANKPHCPPPHSHNAAHPTVMMMMIVQCCSSGPQCFRTEQKFKLDLHGQGLAWGGGWEFNSPNLWGYKMHQAFLLGWFSLGCCFAEGPRVDYLYGLRNIIQPIPLNQT